MNKAVLCTHLVATEDQFQKHGARIRDAVTGSIPIVAYDWLVASLSSDKPVDATHYLLDFSGTDPTTTTKSTPQLDDSGYTSPYRRGTAKDTKSTSKRSIDDVDDAEDDDGGRADTKKRRVSNNEINVPVDEQYMATGCAVFVDDNDVAYDATLNQADSGKNANKFYRCQVIKNPSGSFVCWTRWGRVGEPGQSKSLGDGSLNSAISEFEKKFRDKTGHKWADRDGPPKPKKYTRIEINYDPIEPDQEYPDGRRGSAVSIASSKSVAQSNLPLPVQKLMDFIFDNTHVETALAELEYDATKMPLGNLSQTTLRRGYQVLKDLATLIGAAGHDDNDQMMQLSNLYYTLIPHIFSRSTRPPVLNQPHMIKREVNLLENLTDLRLGNEIMQSANMARYEKLAVADRQFEKLGMKEMSPLVSTSREYIELSDYLTRSSGQTHGLAYQVEDIFRIERDGEAGKVTQSPFASLPPDRSRRALLWHGSRSTNFAGILSQGLRIAPPEAPASGYMFGKGIYLANISTKSANYCFSGASGGTGLLLLCEAQLGRPVLKLKDASYTAGEDAQEQGLISTWGVGLTTPKGWKDAGCVHPDLQGIEMPDVSEVPGRSEEADLMLQYDEFIVYSVAQVRLRYLLRVSMTTM